MFLSGVGVVVRQKTSTIGRAIHAMAICVPDKKKYWRAATQPWVLPRVCVAGHRCEQRQHRARYLYFFIPWRKTTQVTFIFSQVRIATSLFYLCFLLKHVIYLFSHCRVASLINTKAASLLVPFTAALQSWEGGSVLSATLPRRQSFPSTVTLTGRTPETRDASLASPRRVCLGAAAASVAAPTSTCERRVSHVHVAPRVCVANNGELLHERQPSPPLKGQTDAALLQRLPPPPVVPAVVPLLALPLYLLQRRRHAHVPGRLSG